MRIVVIVHFPHATAVAELIEAALDQLHPIIESLSSSQAFGMPQDAPVPGPDALPKSLSSLKSCRFTPMHAPLLPVGRRSRSRDLLLTLHRGARGLPLRGLRAYHGADRIEGVHQQLGHLFYGELSSNSCRPIWALIWLRPVLTQLRMKLREVQGLQNDSRGCASWWYSPSVANSLHYSA